MALALPALVWCVGCIVAIRREDSAPALFRQISIGRNRGSFTF